jgi:group I intron endonuclease
MRYLIYKITNLVNCKIYIGLTSKTLKHRFKGHYLQAKYGASWHISNAIRKYGKDNFKIEEICKCKDLEEANKMEDYYIRILDSINPVIGYNSKFGGDCRGQHTEATIQKLREMNLGSNNPRYGVVHTNEWKKEHSKMMSGDKNPMKNPETAKKSAESRTGNKAYQYIDGRKKAIHYCINNCGNTIHYSNWHHGNKTCKECAKKETQTKEYKERMSATLKEVFKTPEATINKSNAMKLIWENPEYKKKQIARLTALWQDPDYKIKMSKRRKCNEK